MMPLLVLLTPVAPGQWRARSLQVRAPRAYHASVKPARGNQRVCSRCFGHNWVGSGAVYGRRFGKVCDACLRVNLLTHVRTCYVVTSGSFSRTTCKHIQGLISTYDVSSTHIRSCRNWKVVVRNPRVLLSSLIMPVMFLSSCVLLGRE